MAYYGKAEKATEEYKITAKTEDGAGLAKIDVYYKKQYKQSEKMRK